MSEAESDFHFSLDELVDLYHEVMDEANDVSFATVNGKKAETQDDSEARLGTDLDQVRRKLNFYPFTDDPDSDERKGEP